METLSTMSASFDTRWYKAKLSRTRLKKLVKILQEDSLDGVTETELTSVNLTREELQLHKDSQKEFVDALVDGRTYDAVRLRLENEALATMKRVVIKYCKQRKKSKLSTIRKLATGLKGHIPWIPESFKASKYWCQQIRNVLVPSKRQRNKNAEFEGWVMNQIEGQGELKASLAREKCNEMLGEKSSNAWQNYSRRLRRKLGLDSISKEKCRRNPVWKKE